MIAPNATLLVSLALFLRGCVEVSLEIPTFDQALVIATLVDRQNLLLVLLHIILDLGEGFCCEGPTRVVTPSGDDSVCGVAPRSA